MTEDRAVQPEAPTTEAGRRLWNDTMQPDGYGWPSDEQMRAAILAIEAEARAASQERPQPSDDEIRQWLWTDCPHEGKYGDDGELQCRGVDFRRDPLLSLIAHVIRAASQERPPLMVDGLAYDEVVTERAASQERPQPDPEPKHTEGQGEMCDPDCPHWAWSTRRPQRVAQERPPLDVERLRRISELQPEAVAVLRKHGFVMDKVGPLADDADELTRWKVLAFSLYSDIVEASTIADHILEAEYEAGGSVASPEPDE
jgi:hypothetical protein